MSITQNLVYKADLSTGTPIVNLSQPLVVGDQDAHEFVVNLTDKGYKPSLENITCRAYFVRKKQGVYEAETIILPGTVNADSVAVTLNASCYSRSAYFSLFVKLSDNLTGEIRTILIVRGTVIASQDGNVLDPEDVVMTLDELLAQIEAMEQATAEAREATVAANQAVENVEAFKGEIQGDITALTEEIDTLDNAIDYNAEADTGEYTIKSANLYDESRSIKGRLIQTDGKIIASIYNLSQKFAVPAGKKIYISAFVNEFNARRLAHACRSHVVTDETGTVVSYDSTELTSYSFINETDRTLYIRFNLWSELTEYTTENVFVGLLDSETTPDVLFYERYGRTLNDAVVKTSLQNLTHSQKEIVRDNIGAIDLERVKSLFQGFTYTTKNVYNPDDLVKGKYAAPTTGELLANAVLDTYAVLVPNNKKMLVTCNLDGSETRSYRNATRSFAVTDVNGKFVSGNNNEFTSYQYSNTTGDDVVVWVNIWGDGNTYHTVENVMIELLELDAPLTITDYEPFGLMPDETKSANIPDLLPNANRLFEGEINATVDSVLEHLDGVNLAFAFVTDTHITPGNDNNIRQTRDTFANLRAVLERVPINGVFHGGDMLGTNWGGEDQHDSDVYINLLRSWMLQANDKVCIALGNHDGVNGAPPTGPVYAAAMSHNEEYVVREGDNPYYYIDHQKPKVRIIVLNTNDGVYGVSNNELAWLTETMNSVPDGYKVIVVSHIAPSSEDFKTNKDQTIALLNQSGNVIAWICGHEHFDWTVPTSKSGCNFPVIISTCSMAGYITPSEEEVSGGAINLNSRVDKTVSQDSWSIFVYRPDEGKIHLVRFGAGDDRTIDYANWDTTK